MDESQRAAARKHLRTLADALGVEVSWTTTWAKAESWPPACAVLPRLRTWRDYLVGLHELGHCALRHDRSGGDRGEVIEEAEAWYWAAQQCDPDLAAQIGSLEWSKTGLAFVSYIRHTALLPTPSTLKEARRSGRR